jgi:transaldolase
MRTESWSNLMNTNPLLRVQEYGQSIWLDFIRRDLLKSGRLRQLAEEDGLRGVTVNPSILDHAIRETDDYEDAIRALAAEHKSPAQIYETLAVEDVRSAADVFRPLYDRTNGQHGFVSLEVSPNLAHDAEGTVKEGRRLWREADRPNLMIKVPATVEGLDAIRRLIADGINVNVTLLFGLARYRQVARAYMAGIEERLAQGDPVERVASVASFFLSRIDVLVDPILEQTMREGGRRGMLASRLHGQVAICSAKAAYQIYRELFEDGRFHGAAGHGGRVQRLLWASTSTKNPAYSDVKYVDALVGLHAVNTMPMETLEAYRDHGDPAPRLMQDVEQAAAMLGELAELDIDIVRLAQRLEDEGVDKFARSYDEVIGVLGQKQPMPA